MLSFKRKIILKISTAIFKVSFEKFSVLLWKGQISFEKIHTMTENFKCDQNRVPFVPRTIPLSDQFIINEVTQEEVKQIITRMPLGKAPGSDKIPA